MVLHAQRIGGRVTLQNKAVNRSTHSRGNRNPRFPFVPGYGRRSPTDDRRKRSPGGGDQSTRRSIANRRTAQFSIKHLLIATLLVAVMIVSAPTLRTIMPEYRISLFWIVTVVAGMSARWIGWRICWPPGSVGRHAVAFFFATMGCASMIVVFNYDDSVPRLIRDIPDGLGAAALLYAIFTAAIIESGFWLLSSLRADMINGGSPNTAIMGEPSDERER